MQYDWKLLTDVEDGPDKYYYGLHGLDTFYLPYQDIPRLSDMEYGLLQGLVLPDNLICMGFYQWNAEFKTAAGNIGLRVFGYDVLEEEQLKLNLLLAAKSIYTDIFKNSAIVEAIEETLLHAPIPVDNAGFLPMIEMRRYTSNRVKDTRRVAHYELAELIKFNNDKDLERRKWS